ncbi:MAG TPA: ATP-binding protein [Actinomycetota bacterium]
MDHPDATVNLGLPADPASIAVVRAVVASVASRLALPYDAVDDLRIAAAEASALLLSIGPGGSRLCVDLRPSDDDLHLTIWVEGAGAAPELSRREGLAWRVLEGLADEADVREVDGSPAIELRLRTVAR